MKGTKYHMNYSDGYFATLKMNF